MGSSKKKHKKNKEKDRERDRGKTKSSSSLSNFSYDGALNTSGATSYLVEPSSSGWDSDQQLTLGATPKPPSLRLVLKVPPSAYSPATNTTSNITTTTASTVAQHVSYLSQPSQPPLQSHQPYPDPSELSTYYQVPEIEPTTSMTTVSTSSNANLPTVSGFAPDGFGYPNPLVLSTVSPTSKKVKKSKKSKKSKHRKHSHKHSHRKHHHFSASSSSISTAASSNQFDSALAIGSTTDNDWLPRVSAMDSLYNLPHSTSVSTPVNSFATGSDFFPVISSQQTSQFGEFNLLSVNTSSSLHSTQRDFMTSCLPSAVSPIPDSPQKPESQQQPSTKSDWLSNATMASDVITSTRSDTTTHQSYYLSSSGISTSNHCGPEIKLKLSKTSATSQYSANLTHSPSKAPLPPVSTQASLPALVTSPPKTNIATSTTANHVSLAPILSEPCTSTLVPSISINTISMSISPMTPLITPSPTPSSKSSSSHKSNSKKARSEKNLKDLLLHLLKQLCKRDSQNFFAMPVSDLIAPGYSNIISHPMDLSTIRKNIVDGQYRNLGDFKADVKLMCDNAMKYNRPETIYYKSASKLWHYTKNKLFKKDALADYAKSYTKCSPLELSLNPTQPPPSGKSVSNGTSSIFGLSSLATELIPAPTFTSSSNSSTSLRQSALNFESTSLFGGLAALSTSTPFKLDPEPSSVSQVMKSVPTVSLTSLTIPIVKKEIVCDGMTAEELVESVKESARKASEALRRSRNPPAYSYLKRTSSGEITLNTLNTGDIAASTKRVSISNVFVSKETGRIAVNLLTSENGDKLKDTTKEADPKKSDNSTIEPLNESLNEKLNETKGAEMALADSSTDQPTKKEEIEKLKKELLLTYGDEVSLDYALSIARFSRGSEYGDQLVNSLMGVLTGQGHRNVCDQFNKLVNSTEP